MYQSVLNAPSNNDRLRHKSQPAPSLALTERERECLQWTARGKTSWEISRILDISDNTVNFHLKNAVHKMDAANKCHAVAKALCSDLIQI